MTSARAARPRREIEVDWAARPVAGLDHAGVRFTGTDATETVLTESVFSECVFVNARFK